MFLKTWIRQLRGNEQLESIQDVHFLVAEQDLHDAALLDEVLVEQVVEDGVQLFADVLDEKWTSKRKRIFKVSSENENLIKLFK